MTGLLQDLRFALRTLRKSPVFTAAAVLCLALGIGANTLVFSLLNFLLLQPLPVREPERVVRLQDALDRSARSYSQADFEELRKGGGQVAELVAFGWLSIILADERGGQEIEALAVSDDFFPVLGFQPILGRGFDPKDDAGAGADCVALIGEQLWRSRFDGHRDVVGRSVRVDGRACTIVGVAPAAARNLVGYRPQVWFPLSGAWPASGGEGWRNLDVIGRLKPGVSVKQAQAVLRELDRRVQAKRREAGGPENLLIIARATRISGSGGAPLALVFGGLLSAPMLVLLIACSNVASLLLARAHTRRQEIALRLAVGATRGRLLRQLLVEMAVLAGVGAGFALWFSYLLALLLSDKMAADAFAPSPRALLDHRTFVFTLAVAALAVVLAGLSSAWRASRPDVLPDLKGPAARRPERQGRLPRWLVAGQVAGSVLLLGTGVLMRVSVERALDAPPGFDAEHALFVALDPQKEGWTDDETKGFLRRLQESVDALPAVSVSSYSAKPPLAYYSISTSVGGGDGGGPRADVYIDSVGPRYFEALGIHLVRGRGFRTPAEGSAPSEVVVNEALANALWPKDNPIGKRLTLHGASAEVVGVTRWTAEIRAVVERSHANVVYTPLSWDAPGRVCLIVRTTGDPYLLQAPLRDVVKRLAPSLAILELKTLSYQWELATDDGKSFSSAFAFFGLLGLAIAVIGLAGLMNHSVARRRHEVGVRLALGASARDILVSVVGDGLRLVGFGLLVGLPLAVLVTHLLGKTVYGMRPLDPAALSSVAVVLLVVGLLACYFPARRAAKTDPMTALRFE